MKIILTYRPYFTAMKLYRTSFPPTERGGEKAVSFLRDYATSVANPQVAQKIINFASQEENRHAQLSKA